GQSRFGDRQADGWLAPRAGTNEQANVELTSGDCRRAKHSLRTRREFAQPLRDQRRAAARESQLGNRRPLPSVSAVPDRSVFDQRTKQLGNEEWIPFRVPV